MDSSSNGHQLSAPSPEEAQLSPSAAISSPSPPSPVNANAISDSPSGIPIDPMLIHECCLPGQTAEGNLVSKAAYKKKLAKIKVKKPLQDACRYLQLHVGSRANLLVLQGALVRHWYPSRPATSALQPSSVHAEPRAAATIPENCPITPSRQSHAALEANLDIDNDALVDEYDVLDGMGREMLGALDVGDLEGLDKDEEPDEDVLAEGDNFESYKTQKSVVKSWQIFLDHALAEGKVHDDIVDEHSLLVFLEFSANRCRRNKCGEYIPNTRVGVSQIKKEFFGALRIRKMQDVRDPSLATCCPATTVHVYDALKTRMDKALSDAREGLIPADDAPDIHCELKSMITGHLAWTMMNASGNCGDDVRALRLCEMQPYLDFVHPNGETSVFAILGLQSNQETKTRSKAMQTRECQICLIHGETVTVLYHPTALLNLFGQAFKKANVQSWIKVHLARHMLGYNQAKMGVNSNETAKMGWSHGTYQDVYAPAILKTAVLAAHGFQPHETYKPIWTKVKVPDQFLQLVLLMAEENLCLVDGRENLVGAANYWKMAIRLRPYLFQCAAAIYQILPQSSMFHLPALAQDDLFLVAHVERIQNEMVRKVIEQLCQQHGATQTSVQQLALGIEKLMAKVDRRTLQWSPAKSADNSNLMWSEILVGSALAVSDQSLHGFVVPSPQCSCNTPQLRTPVDLVVPPLFAFWLPGKDLFLSEPLFDETAVTWAKVFSKIKQPAVLWDIWKPSKSLDQMSVHEVWDCYNVSEAIFDEEGNQTGVKPPLCLVHQRFQSLWRKSDLPRKFWQRFCEIPKWIEKEIKTRAITAKDALAELEAFRKVPGKVNLLRTNALTLFLVNRRKEEVQVLQVPELSGVQVLQPEQAPTMTGAKCWAPTIAGRPKPKRTKQ
ncbi:unnamed protein product [Cyclocybe aegerita]|uniref:Uncharacterized protein n=1 Tax=Cyclocybe aegerita TaxID=1973307 RepID=A0A8S0WXH4_CYCAE|nr:unnamed protein product [Cyclocybe aegerita]